MQVIILSGIPGCGKTTYVDKHKASHPTKWVESVSADHFFETDSGYKFDPTKLAQAHTNCLCRYLHYLSMGANGPDVVFVDNTNIYEWERQVYLTAMQGAQRKTTFQVVSWVARTLDDVRVCMKRNRHSVPKEVIFRMAMEHEVVDDVVFSIGEN